MAGRITEPASVISTWPEEFADQLGLSSEPTLRSRLNLWELGFDQRQHPRQRHRELAGRG